MIDARPIVYWPWTVVRTSQRGKEKGAEGDRDRECAREDDRALPIDSDGIIHILRAERPGGLFVARAVRTRNKGYRKLVYSLMAADRIIRYIRPGFRLANVSFNFILPRCNEGRQNSRPRYSHHRATYAPEVPRGWPSFDRTRYNSSIRPVIHVFKSNALILSCQMIHDDKKYCHTFWGPIKSLKCA